MKVRFEVHSISQALVDSQQQQQAQLLSSLGLSPLRLQGRELRAEHGAARIGGIVADQRFRRGDALDPGKALLRPAAQPQRRRNSRNLPKPRSASSGSRRPWPCTSRP